MSRQPAFSYYSQRSLRESSENQNRNMALRDALLLPRRMGWRVLIKQKFGLLIVALAAITCLVNILIVSPNAKIDSLNTPSTSYLIHDQQVYKTAVDGYLDASIFNVTKLTINTANVEAGLRKDFPELTNVKVALPLIGHRPVVYIRTAEPTLILAGPHGQAFVIDENGTALATLSSIRNADKLTLPVVQDESGILLKRGDTVLSSNASVFVRDIVAELKVSGIMISRMSLPAATSELDVYPANSNYFVKFNLQHNSAMQQAGTYLAVIAHLTKQGTTPTAYIDVRLDGRAYYK